MPESGERDEGTQVEDGEGKESMWEGLVATWKEVNEPIFEEDMCYAALAVKYRLEIIESTKECMASPEQEVREWAIAERQQALLELLPNIGERDPGLIYGYWMVRWSRIWKSQRLRSSHRPSPASCSQSICGRLALRPTQQCSLRSECSVSMMIRTATQTRPDEAT